MLFIRSAIFLLFQMVTAILFSLIGFLLWPLPFKWRYKIMSRWAVLNLWFVEKICGVKYQVEGLDNIPDEPCVIMCKHQSAWETLVLQAVFPPQVWVLKRELLWIPFFGWGLAVLNPIAIDRGAGRKALNQVLEQGKDRLASGAWVVVFPEGTRIPRGEMGRFGMGAARLAVEAGCAVVPVAHDAGKAWPRHSFIRHPGTIKLVIGEKITSANKKAVELNEQVYQWMEQQMTRLEGSKPTTRKTLVKEDKKRG